MAQEQVRLMDLAALSAPVDLGKDTLARAGLQAAGLSDEQIGAAVTGARTDRWPEGLRTDSARAANTAAAANYNAERFCSFSTGEHSMAVLRIPFDANYHMPDELRTTSDFYLTVPEHAIATAVLTDADRPKPSKGPSYRNMPKARITRPDGVYATYDLAKDPKALAVLEHKGLSPAEIEAVVFRSMERNWPEGMDSFAERYPRLEHFKKMKTFRAARWDGKVLLVVPAELNRKLPPHLRPYLDIYMVFQEEAVAVAGGK